MAPERVARHQKARLQGAMVEVVARHGYAGTTLRELVALAGVSKTTFYQHFESKRDCFLSTFDQIVAILAARVSEAYRSEEEFRPRLVAALTAFMNLAVEEPNAASLAAVESLTLGGAGVARRERASAGFEALVQQSFDHSPTGAPVAPVVVRAIVAGIRGVAYRRLRAGQPEELPGSVETLVDWALSYQQPESDATRRAVEAAREPSMARSAIDQDEEVPDWEEPPDSRRSKARLTQRERIVRAAAMVVVDRGYEALSIPAISAAAGTSNQTFYENFDSKRDALLAAFEIVAADALTAGVSAFEAAPDGPEAIGAGLRALTEYIAGHSVFARLAFFELPTAGPAALDRADQILDGFTAFLTPELAPPGVDGVLPSTALAAIATGIWSVIQHEIASERSEHLPQLAPELARIALAPFGAAELVANPV
ncbi:MAG: TetR/AcrR family transcriptional regulator [Thermoleophilia bacterium]|nr:TetR/AcrR family transcriptional regulator [Thermoleophilia bacterium]